MATVYLYRVFFCKVYHSNGIAVCVELIRKLLWLIPKSLRLFLFC